MEQPPCAPDQPARMEPKLSSLGDGAVLITLGDSLSLECNARVHELCHRIRQRQFPWLIACVPAYASVAVHYDPRHCDWDRRYPLSLQLRAALEPEMNRLSNTCLTPRLVEIPVLYGGEMGPDLEEVAAHCQLSIDEVIQRHAAADYQVCFLGFMPGFPYLAGLPEELAVPRLATPRTRVAAGSLAIGGRQTGIYPQASPGGWRIIGRTPLVLFDGNRLPATLLQAGDHIRFMRIGMDDFERMSQAK